MVGDALERHTAHVKLKQCARACTLRASSEHKARVRILGDALRSLNEQSMRIKYGPTTAFGAKTHCNGADGGVEAVHGLLRHGNLVIENSASNSAASSNAADDTERRCGRSSRGGCGTAGKQKAVGGNPSDAAAAPGVPKGVDCAAKLSLEVCGCCPKAACPKDIRGCKWMDEW
jgi:hypothetical protein